jgi:hypothetical protein
MRLLPPRVLLLTGPVALAFFAGGYGDRPRLVALAAAAVLLAALALTAPLTASGPSGRATLLPTGFAARSALAGLLGLTAWIAVSRSWSPVADAAGDDLERVGLYAIVLICSLLAWRDRAAARWAEVAVAAGALVVVGYGLAGRLLPGLVPERASVSAGGRLEQPLTYWNAEGALAAIGFVLCARIAGDRERPVWLRAAAAAAAVPLAAGTYLTFSRGAIVALVSGIVVLLVLAPSWTQLRAVAICGEMGVAGTFATVISPAVRTLAGDTGTREAEGAAVLVALLAVMGAAALLVRWAASAERAGTTRMGRLPLPRRAGLAATLIVVALVAVPVSLARSTDGPSFGATSARLTTASSNRYEYWKVALRSFADHPLAGVGSGGFRTEWLRERTFPERVRDAHSLQIETLAELGLVGALLLAALLGGIAGCARTVQRDDPALAAGPVAALVVFAVHSAVDWDWEMPALTLPVLVLAGLLLAQAGTRTPTPTPA